MSVTTILFLDEGRHPAKDFVALSAQQKDFRLESVGSSEELLRRLQSNACDIILTPVSSFAQVEPLIPQMKNIAAHVPIIVAAAEPQVNDAVAALRAGIHDYLTPPFEVSSLLVSVQKALAATRATQRPAPPVGAPGGRFPSIIGESRKMKQVFSLIERVCDADTTVLIQGESGTGKELIAQALHYQGDRRQGLFVPVNCGAIPGELLESELFGHEKGAFTHAIRTRIGRFEMADGGTVFLDEISEMSPMLQVKILRVLQERQFERIGGTKTIKSDFRVIAATNRNLEEEVRAGRFREDLYYRLNVIPIEAPPLRDRPSDIPLLVASFMERFGRAKKKTMAGAVPEVMDRLLRYPWPGNVRELENIIERMVILAPGEILTLEDLPERIQVKACSAVAAPAAFDEIPPQGFSLSDVVSDFEKKLIYQALGQTGWVKNRAAKLLNVNRTTLIEKMKRYQIVNQQ